MTYGLPDSWGAWAAKRIVRSASGSGIPGRRTAGSLRVPITYTYKFQHLVLYENVLKEYLNGPTGDLWFYLESRAQVASFLAKNQVGVVTGALRESIKVTHTPLPRGQIIRIGSDKHYAHMHHEGTRPHQIIAKDGGLLVFSSKGQIVKTRQVNHPGTKPNRYLSDQLKVFLK